MQSWSFYPAFVATFLSFVGWTFLIMQKHDRTSPKTLSELAAEEDTLVYGRAVLWICGVLFAITIYFFIVPRSEFSAFVFIAGTGMVACELLTGVFPANNRWWLVHEIFAQIMGISMGMLALCFALALHGGYAALEVTITFILAVLGTAATVDRKQFIYYEMPFVWLSHISILIAAVALR